MTTRSTILAAISPMAFVGAAHADSLRPIEGRSIRLGEVSGIAYYTVERDGFRVVATLGQVESGTPVRVEAVLASGQSVVLSTPREASGSPDSVEILRLNDQVLVHESAATN